MKNLTLIILLLCSTTLLAQDLSQGLIANDLSEHLMDPDVPKPAYLGTIIDPQFGTTIRRISDVGDGGVIKPMYSTIQAWNSDESLMILYDQSKGVHQLLDGITYEFIRNLDDVKPDDLEQLFWDFNDPNHLYYLESISDDFIKYNVNSKEKNILVNLDTASGCNGNISLGNDVQMMSWDSDIISFRCDNSSAYYYKISTGTTTPINVSNVNYTAPMPGPSGTYFYHNKKSYNSTGNLQSDLNQYEGGHSCIGQLANGNDAKYAVAFDATPIGGCLGEIVAHDLETGECFSLISRDHGYNYTQSGTHISALAHKNTQNGWVAASMIGYKNGGQDGQSLLDQELVIARAIDKDNINVYRIAHHRSDEDEFDYWGEPHVVLSPTGTRVLFGSDWSGAEDGKSVDSYVVELPSYNGLPLALVLGEEEESRFTISPNPIDQIATISIKGFEGTGTIKVINPKGIELLSDELNSDSYMLDAKTLSTGLYYIQVIDSNGKKSSSRIIKK